MTDTDAGTNATGGEAPPTGTAPAAPAAGTPGQPDEVTTLRSRNAGLDAKVTELQRKAAEAEAKAAAAAAKLADYEAGKVGADEALRAQVAAKEAELAEVRKLAALARIESKYPETFGVLGAAAVGLTEDQLAASEARMAGLPPEAPTPGRPIGNNAGRPLAAGSKAIEDMSVSELKAHLRSFDASVWGGHSD